MSETTMLPTTNGQTTPEKPVERHPARWAPGELLAQMQAEMDRVFGERWPFAGLPFARPLRRLMELPTAWTPRVDVYEQEGALVVKAELPGIRKEDVEVAIGEGNLIIRGERKAEAEVKEEHYYRMERSFGAFYRRLPLPEGVKTEAIEATFTDGVLAVRVPKPAARPAEPTRIAIK